MKDLDHLQNQMHSLKEDSIFKSSSLRIMSDQVNALIEEISTRDDVKDKYMDLQNKY